MYYHVQKLQISIVTLKLMSIYFLEGSSLFDKPCVKTYIISCANRKESDQLALPRMLVSVFPVRIYTHPVESEKVSA